MALARAQFEWQRSISDVEAAHQLWVTLRDRGLLCLSQPADGLYSPELDDETSSLPSDLSRATFRSVS